MRSSEPILNSKRSPSPQAGYIKLNILFQQGADVGVSLLGGGRKSLTSDHTREQDRALCSEDERVRSTKDKSRLQKENGNVLLYTM